MFSDKFQLTKAVLEGRKNMTRRVIKSDWLQSWGDKGKVKITYDEEIGCFLAYVGPNDTEPMVLEPKYKPGEVVAVAQAYKDTCWTSPVLRLKDEPGWSNKMFVYAGLMPHQIRITNVRVERLQDISDEDCIREGVIENTATDILGGTIKGYTIKGVDGGYVFAREAFSALINRISGRGTWESNPWVFVYEFELVK